MTVEWTGKRWGVPGRQWILDGLPQADNLRDLRDLLSDVEPETNRLLSIACDAITSPAVRPVVKIKALREDAAERAMAELRARGYFANWIINGDGEFAVALDEKDAPDPEAWMNEAFGP